MMCGDIRAVIWDMDGIIADTADFHMAAWQEIFRKRGVEFTEEDFRHTFGQRNDITIRGVLGADVSREEIERIGNEKEADYRHRIRQNIAPLPGVISLLESLAGSGFRQAVASSAPFKNVRQILTSLDIESFFSSVISEKDVSEGKPSPQAFLLAAQRLGVNPACCVVIEDAVAGVAAARRGGMRCIAVTNTHPRERLGEADLIVDSLEKVGIAVFEDLLSRKSKQVQ
ncbi:MAG TPA: HAD family phosphatase [Dehalococcoidia bacterium]|nr:HAD family phosphatase [Dehalococcoidia bacterium]